ncbi:PepSY domain-containing protein [Ochrobactrum tritici]|uniref:PepSY domain-containing protein n=1 Tax=Brucella tritici TaxID=94626 RepID=A0A7X6FSC0_9HYPH|nr:PepSY domain-containing protein [Brucella tritici]NKW11163.1 PepSY domain-containing protein [Brucella tritici]
MKHLLAAILVLAFSGPGIAKADDDDCHVSMDRWKPREAVETMAAGQGWTVARIKIDDGCYEIRGTDRNGLTFKAKVDPETLEIVSFRHRDRYDDRHGSRRQRPPASENDAVGGHPPTPCSGRPCGPRPPSSSNPISLSLKRCDRRKEIPPCLMIRPVIPEA